MNFESLLNYQKADAEYKKCKKQIASDPNYKRMRQAKEQFDDAKKKCGESEGLAQNIMNAYNEALKFLEKTEKEVEKLVAQVSDGSLSEEKENEAIERLNQLRAEFAEWEKKTASLKANADKAIADYSAAQKSGQSARAEYQTSKKAYEEVSAKVEVELKKLEEEKNKARSAVDEKLLELYDTVSVENKGINNIFVPMMGDEKSPICGGCGMEFPTAKKDELFSKGYIRCENCHRVIYKQ